MQCEYITSCKQLLVIGPVCSVITRVQSLVTHIGTKNHFIINLPKSCLATIINSDLLMISRDLNICQYKCQAQQQHLHSNLSTLRKPHCLETPLFGITNDHYFLVHGINTADCSDCRYIFMISLGAISWSIDRLLTAIGTYWLIMH